MSQSPTERVAVVTGASSGIGKAAAKALAKRGWRVIGLGRDAERCATAEAELRAAAPGAHIAMIRADLSLLRDAARAADGVAALTDRIDVLINNAGGVASAQRITEEGNEATFASNHLGPFVLTHRLLPLLRKAAAGKPAGTVRVLATSSSGHRVCAGMDWNDLQRRHDYNNTAAYTSAKLANILFTLELAKRLAADGIVAHAMEPGVVLDSNFVNHAADDVQRYMATQDKVAVSSGTAAETLVHMAVSDEAGRDSGGYYHQCQRADTSPAARDSVAAARLWRESEALVAQVGVGLVA